MEAGLRHCAGWGLRVDGSNLCGTACYVQEERSGCATGADTIDPIPGHTRIKSHVQTFTTIYRNSRNDILYVRFVRLTIVQMLWRLSPCLDLLILLSFSLFSFLSLCHSPLSVCVLMLRFFLSDCCRKCAVSLSFLTPMCSRRFYTSFVSLRYLAEWSRSRVCPARRPCARSESVPPRPGH